MSDLNRETLVEQSVQDFARAGLRAQAFTDDDVEWMESFDEQRLRGLTKNTIAYGFTADDTAVQAELGSDLVTRPYHFEFFVFGTTRTWARTLANALKFELDKEGLIPLVDVGDADRPVLDQLIVQSVTARHEPISEPEPWQRFIFTVRLQVEDTYSSRLAA